VNLVKLGRQLKRDLTRNPKKAGVLALLLIVAVYFWAPLLIGWASDETPVAAQDAGSVAAAATPAGDALEPTSPEAVPSWDVLASHMAEDRMASAAEWVAERRVPFLPSGYQLALAQQEQAEHQQPTTPEELGWKLTGVLISRRSRLAQINGVSIALGDVVSPTRLSETPSDDMPAEPAFELVYIGGDFVVLQQGTNQYRLEWDRPKLAHGDQVVVRRKANSD